MRPATAAVTFSLTAIVLNACGPQTAPPADVPASATQSTGVRPGSGFEEQYGEARDRVLFPYDSAAISEHYLSILKDIAEFLKKRPDVTVTIEGHADERGTRDYNLALGERRAIAVKHVLAALGIDNQRMSLLSYGKERPAVIGSSEYAWSQNRRAVVTVN
jgi:peptidoglycan-associated lipoprotein